MPDHALKLFDEMSKRTQLSFSALLSVFLHYKQYDTVIEKFNQLPSQLNITAGLAAHNVYLKALCAKGEVGAARKVLEEMTESKRLVPDIASYNAVLEGFLMKKDEVGFDESLEEIARRGLEPNVHTYNCRISMLCAKSQSFRAEEVLEVKVSKGLHPNLASFNVLIKEGDVGSTVRVLKRMRVMKRVNGKDGASPNSETYNMLIKSLVEKGEFGLGVEICGECLVRKFLPPIEAVKGLIEGLMKNDSVEEAKSVIEKMRTVVKGDAAETWKEESALAL